MKEERKTDRRRIWFLAVGMITFLFIGILYAWSILKVPLAEEFLWTASKLSVNFTITFCFFCIGGIFGSRLTRRVSCLATLLIAAALVMAGYGIVSCLDENRIGMLYLGYGVMSGFGIGMAYNAVISVVHAWFPDRSGLSSGLLMMAFGISSLAVGKLAEALIQCDAVGWRKTYLILGAAMTVVLAVAALTLRFPKDDELPCVVRDDVSDNSGKQGETGREYTTAEMLRSPIFYGMFFFLVLVSAVGNCFFSMTREYAVAVGYSTAAASTLVGLCSICNGVGRIVSGAALDRFGRKAVMLSANIAAIIAPIAAVASIGMSSKVIGLAAICLMGLCYGCCPSIAMSETSGLFGKKHYSSNFSVMNFNLMVGSLFASGAGVMITRSGSFVGPFVIMSVFACGALALNLAVNRRV